MMRASDRIGIVAHGVLTVLSGALCFALLLDVGAHGSQLAICSAAGCSYTLYLVVMLGLLTAFLLFMFLVLLATRKKRPWSMTHPLLSNYAMQRSSRGPLNAVVRPTGKHPAHTEETNV
ncbi:MAG: hypothetical protein WD929_08250 [Steroidobacteraceae bacterium]